METAKLFNNGRSQAVRLPKAFRFKGREVYVKRTPEGVLLIPKGDSVWDIWEQNLMKYEDPFMTDRNQPNRRTRFALSALQCSNRTFPNAVTLILGRFIIFPVIIPSIILSNNS